MKNALFILVSFVTLSTATIAQNAISTVGEGEFKELKSENQYVFFMSPGTSVDLVYEMADQFEGVIEVGYDEDRSLLKLTLASNHISHRAEVERFLTGMEVEEVRIDGQIFGLNDFADIYIMSR